MASMKKDMNRPWRSYMERFLEGINRVKDRPVDIFIDNLVWNNDTFGKYERLAAGEQDAFVDSSEWKRFLEKCAENVKKM